MKNFSLRTKRIPKIIFPGVLVLLNASCGTTNIQSVNVKSLAPSPPVRITEDREDHLIDMHMNISLNTKSTIEGNIGGHSKVNKDGIYEIEQVPNEDYFLEYKGKNYYDFKGNNITWELPVEQAVFDLDLALLHEITVTAGFIFSNFETKQHLGYSLGFGHFSESPESAWRVDFMLTNNTRETEIQALHKETDIFSNSEKVRFFNLSQSRKYQNWSLSYTFNSKNSFLVDYFWNASIGFEEMFNQDSPLSDARLSDTLTYYSLAAGFYKNTFGIGRLVLGGRVTMFMMEQKNMYLPNLFLQYDIFFF